MSGVRRAIFNGANLCWLILTLLTVANALLSTNIPTHKSKPTTQTEIEIKKQNVQARILWDSYSPFGARQYYVWWGNGIWLLQSRNFLPTGNQLLFETQIQKYDWQDINRQERYALSLGVSGRLEPKSEFQIKNCDWICQLIRVDEKIRTDISNTYKKSLCSDINLYKAIYPQVLCRDLAGLAQGLVLGGSDGLSDDTKNNIKKLGLSHIVAVSGFQVVMVANTAEYVLLRLRLSRLARVLAGVSALSIMICLVGPQPPVLRSALGISISMLTLFLLGRRIEAFRLLGYTAMIMLWMNPGYIYSVSFQLSFLASLGLVMVGRVEPLIYGFWSDMQENVLTTLLAFLFTLPVILNLSGKISLLSILVNLLVVPFIPILTLFELLGLIPYIGSLFLLLAGLMKTVWLYGMAEFAAVAPQIAVTPLSLVQGLIYYVLLVSICLFINLSRLSKKLKQKSLKL